MRKYELLVGIFIICLTPSCIKKNKNDNLKTITVAWDSIPRTIDPRFAVDANSQYLEDLLHCSLIDFDPDGKVIGDLAKSWDWKSPTELQIQIKSEASFSDGTPVTSQDVKATYDFFAKKDLKNPSPRAGAFTIIKKIEAVDSTNLVFTLNEPDSTFLTNLVVGVIPAKIAEKEMYSEPADSPSCGPFLLSNMQLQSIRLAPNKHYKIATVPQYDQLKIEVIGDETTSFAKLRKGEVDIIQNTISRDKVAEITKRFPQLNVLRKAGLNTSYLGFNMQDKYLKNPNVRQAIAHAINRDEIIKFVLKGLAIPATTMLPPSDPYYKDTKSNDYNITLAQEMLNKSGFPDPDGDGPLTRFELEYKTTTNLTNLTIAKAIAAQLTKIGIGVKVQPLDWGKFKSDVEKGNVQLWTLSWVGFKDPDIYRFAFATSSFVPDGGNRGRYSNKKLDALLEQGRKTVDLAARKKIYDQVQEIVATDLPYVFLWHQENFAITNSKIKNFVLYADGRYTSLRETVRK